jgi:hypothetical protein
MAAIAALFMGCAHAAKEVAREATPGGVEGAIDSLSKPDNRQRVGEIAGETTRQISRAAVLGTRDALREMNVIGADGTIQASLLAKQTSGVIGSLGVTGLIAVGLAVVVVGLSAALLILVFRARRRRERRRRDRRRRHQSRDRRIAKLLHAARDRPWGKELERLVPEGKVDPDPLENAGPAGLASVR